MKKLLLIFGIFVLSINQIFAATDFGESTYEFISSDVVYTGKDIPYRISLFEKGTNHFLTQGTDYNLEIKLDGTTVPSLKNAGTYQLVLTPVDMQKYSGQKIIELIVEKADLDQVTVNGVNTDYLYNGSAIEPTISVLLKGIDVTSDNYTITYGENTNVASGGTITLSPNNGNFSGKKEIKFNITPVDIPQANAVAITLSPASYSYTGSVITPTIQSVTVDGKTLTTSDYTIDEPQAGTNTDPGNGMVSITGTGNYTGSASQSFAITKGDLSGATITLEKESYDYLGAPVKPAITSVTLDGRTLIADTDYTVDAIADGANFNVGDGSIGISGINKYTGSASKTFKITPIPLKDNVAVTITSQKYTGKEITPDAADLTVICHNTNVLTFDTDFTIKGYENNINEGTATVTLEGKGNFTGEIKGEFTIEKEPMTADMFSVTVNKAFTGNPVELTAEDIVATDGDKTLVPGTDFEIISYTTNTKAGTATVVLKGKGSYAGTVTVNFTIAPAPLTAEMFTIGDKAFTGDSVTLASADITAAFNSVSLEPGTDYTLSNYTDNTNAGTAAVTISGKGNYKGDVTVNFTITPIPLNAHMFTLAKKEYNGTAIELADSDITATNGDKDLALNTDYILGAYTNNTNAGNATVTIDGKGNYSGSVPVNFTIVPATLTADMFTSITPKEYTGKDITLSAGDIVSSLTYGTDYTIGCYTNNNNAGKASVIFNGTGNYKGTTDTLKFDITPVALTENMITVGQQYYSGGSIHPQPVVKLGDVELFNTGYTVSYPDTEDGAYVEPGLYSAQRQPDRVGNYDIPDSRSTGDLFLCNPPGSKRNHDHPRCRNIRCQ